MKSISIRLLLPLLALAMAAAAVQAAPHAQPFPGVASADQTARATLHRAPGVTSVTFGTFTDPVAAALAIGNRLVDIQADVTSDNAGNGADPGDSDADDGGWDWVVTGATQHPAGASYENLYGPIARGLAEAAIFTGSARLGTGTGDVFAGISQPGVGLLSFPYFRIWDGDIATAYIRWAAKSGNAALKDTIKARHDTELVVRGGAGGRARTIRNGRAAGGQVGLWPWDVHLLSNDSKALVAAFPGSAAVYEAEVDSVAQVVMDDKNGLLGTPNWDPTAFLQDWHQLAVAGALRCFDASQRVDDNALATAMRDTLVNGQLANGSWGVSYGGVFYSNDIQTTAYCVLALMEYGQRHTDAVARHAAARGASWLLEQVQAGGVINDGGGEYAEVSGEVVQALLVGDEVTPQAPATCITPTYPCVQVPVVYNRIDTTPVRGYSVTLTLSANLALCGAGIVQGAYLSGVGGTHYEVIANGGGSYTVDCTILGLPCGATGTGTLFTLNLASSDPSGTGTVTINSVTVRDCSNGPVTAVPGPAGSITIDNTAPAAIANLAAAQVKTGNDADGTTKITLTFTPPGDAASVEVYRAPYGNYPEYDDAPNAGSPPAAPSYPPGAPWAPTGVTASGQTDELGPAISTASHLEVFGTWSGLNWVDPRTNYAYRMAGTAVGKNNHDQPPGPPTGFPTGTMDPNLATITWFRLPQGGTITITGSFTTALAAGNFATNAGQFLTVGLINKPWVDYATGPSFGYNSGMFNTPSAGVNGNAYLLFYKNGANVRTAMEDRNSGNVTSPDQRDVASVSTFSVQFQDGLDKTGAVVATGGRMRYALDGGAYGPWDNNSHDFRQLTTLQLGAYTVDGGLLSADFGAIGAAIRDFWYYVAFSRDACGNLSAVSNRTNGTLNYHLGDVTDGVIAGNGNNVVTTADVSLLGAHYGAVLASLDPFNYLDVGPTTDYSVNARPTTDNKVNFEDLMMFAINYGTVSMPQFALVPAVANRNELSLETVRSGDDITATLRMRGAGDLQGLSTHLSWDAAVVVPVSMEPGELVLRQGGVVLSAEPGDVDAALLGVRGQGLGGDGVLATVTFRVISPGDPRIAIASLEGRDTENRPVDLATGATPVRPAVTALAPAKPNPFGQSTTLSFSLAQGGPVELAIYSVDGRRVRTVLKGSKEPGVYRLSWDGTDARGQLLKPGLFYARLVTDRGHLTRTLVLVK